MGYWLFNPDKPKPPLPEYQGILLEDVPPGSTLLYYGGVPVTEWVGRKKGFPYRTPPFHASLMVLDGMCLNMGWKPRIIPVQGQMQSTRRIDVVLYNDLSDKDRFNICASAALRNGRGNYDWRGFLSHGIKWIQPSRRQDYCSQQVVSIHRENDHIISYKPEEESAPWDLYYFGAGNPYCELRTLHIGKDFKP